jgi:hypothetical protein
MWKEHTYTTFAFSLLFNKFIVFQFLSSLLKKCKNNTIAKQLQCKDSVAGIMHNGILTIVGCMPIFPNSHFDIVPRVVDVLHPYLIRNGMEN